MTLPDRPEDAALSGTFMPLNQVASLYEEVPLSGSLNRNSSSRACGNVENFDSAPVSEAVEAKTKEAGAEQETTSKESLGVQEGGENKDALGVKLAKAGWKVVRLGNHTPQDTDAVAGSLLRKTIKELAWSKRIDRRARSS
jgi:hypothetical protein